VQKVDVWFTKLKETEDACRRYWPVLDGNEQNRALRHAHPTLKYRYVETHGLLRHLLSRRLGQAPERINIQTAEHGKPYLPDFPDWTFNLSHCDHHLAIAIAQACRLGIDIELIKPRNGFLGLVQKCFAATEAAYWHGLDPTEQSAAFYRIWTAKEAFVKATGRGIAVGLEQCVTDPHRFGQFCHIPPAYGAAADWHLFPLAPATDPELCGCLAADKELQIIDYHPLD